MSRCGLLGRTAIRRLRSRQFEAVGKHHVEIDHRDGASDACARQAEAERERRAKVIHAEGELQAAEKLRDAAAMLSQQPQALQLRYLQTLGDMSSNGKSSTIVFPLPLDLIKPLMDAITPKAEPK